MTTSQSQVLTATIGMAITSEVRCIDIDILNYIGIYR